MITTQMTPSQPMKGLHLPEAPRPSFQARALASGAAGWA